MKLFSRCLSRNLLFTALALVSLGYAVQFTAGPEIADPILRSLVHLFDINVEMNLPTWFSSMLLAFSGAICLHIGQQKQPNKTTKRDWVSLGVLLIFFSADEMTAIHEIPSAVLRDSLNITGGPFFFSWVIIGLPFVILCAMYFERFLHHLPSTTRKRILLAGGLYVFGALGLEMIGGWYWSAHSPDGIYTIIFTIEEALEMVGMVLFIDALLLYSKNCHPEFIEG